MKKTLIAVALTGALVSAPALQAEELSTDQEKLSYSLGLILGQKLKMDIEDLDIDAFRSGVETVYSEEEPLLTQEEMGAVMQSFQQQQMQEQQAAMAKMAEDNKAAGDEFMAENGKKDGVVTTDSGLQYEELSEGEGASPSEEDTVKVHYRGTLIDGTEFDSSYARDKPVSFPLNGVIPGWTEGLQMMKEGGKARLVIPSDLAYGPGGMGNAIGPNETLVFEVELLEINPDSDAQ
ncbi:FKBP-type peptidyl-prolyl cis-trans isomerase [Marinobacterium mangrovicola]|uniref:Peptidyl-prolyl cis-trans isomerase n=1 Tax=Marinobacterium mangrovicola TaxID=1476959 RepID=A0A4R1GCT9_9GAMM|nr:FKBP-type peptidyl-prolyl cis-trans isomerase [Marinobacterium mangrovicola]TCK06097.1 FKBP-type peptidyl-prolyl cis-trans isomerase FklB [Marinobacterium mangrovicola]